ncbi:FMN-binding negative transcriptional regulator [Vibrio sp. OCN044]|uniref:FMN-binding negative transcriptional regulator n=1 Tax=Vibrio tetraodonis subsp. pristinus TaxID=2695891 RepID=A0A6L8M322_9VIBR|nr:FMN-binding negative transcriptional regulator [Vibrio tetraodonis]MYM59992.1 FMN-binding negative transcriptional regulator [Vibrio tetraodonis subsp. pristinus]
MHIPEKWKMNSEKEIFSFIKENSFASVISDDLEASHLPLLLDENEGEKGTLYGHFSRANHHWKRIDGAKVLVIFSGPHSYISPTWYKTSPAVPTWNYSAVHVIGTVQLIDEGTTFKTLDETVKIYDPTIVISESFKTKLSKGIVGFKISISSLQGKEKLGQHRSKEDQLGVTSALSKAGDIESQKLYKYMVSKGLGIGNQ